MSAAPAAPAPRPPALEGQFYGAPVVPLDAGQLAWLWTGGGIGLVKVVGPALTRDRTGQDAPGTAVVALGRVMVVPSDRLTAVPTVAPDPARPYHV
jgi:hypothetical protein